MTGRPKSTLMARLRARRQREGLVRLDLWVPGESAEAVKSFAESMTISQLAAKARKAKRAK